MEILLLYAAVISLITAAVTVYDKIAAKKGAWRIPEKTLLLLALTGGAAAELAVMLAIRHKTKHKKFMIGLPAMLILHVAIVAAAVLFIL
ncbi:MAG: DUF1294 domain-containing protein [Clostridia bacterium]|nr:DUF1294 domain-containing protein [Clostridia bacterium]